MNDPFLNDMAKRFAELKEITRECEKCEHYQTYIRDDGTVGYRCEHYACEFTPKQAQISHISPKDETWDEDMKWDAAQYMAEQEDIPKDEDT